MHALQFKRYRHIDCEEKRFFFTRLATHVPAIKAHFFFPFQLNVCGKSIFMPKSFECSSFVTVICFLIVGLQNCRRTKGVFSPNASFWPNKMNECCLFCNPKFGSFYMFAFITLLLLLSMVTSMNSFHRNAYSVSWPRAIETLTVF